MTKMKKKHPRDLDFLKETLSKERNFITVANLKTSIVQDLKKVRSKGLGNANTNHLF
jgi:hypothetical protein